MQNDEEGVAWQLRFHMALKSVKGHSDLHLVATQLACHQGES